MSVNIRLRRRTLNEAPYCIYKYDTPYCGLAMGNTTPELATHTVVDYSVCGHWLWILCNNGIVRKFPLTLDTVYNPETKQYDRRPLPSAALNFGYNFRGTVSDTLQEPSSAVRPSSNTYMYYNSPYSRIDNDPDTPLLNEDADGYPQLYQIPNLYYANSEQDSFLIYMLLNMVMPSSPLHSTSVFPSDSSRIYVEPIITKSSFLERRMAYYYDSRLNEADYVSITVSTPAGDNYTMVTYAGYSLPSEITVYNDKHELIVS